MSLSNTLRSNAKATSATLLAVITLSSEIFACALDRGLSVSFAQLLRSQYN